MILGCAILDVMLRAMDWQYLLKQVKGSFITGFGISAIAIVFALILVWYTGASFDIWRYAGFWITLGFAIGILGATTYPFGGGSMRTSMVFPKYSGRELQRVSKLFTACVWIAYAVVFLFGIVLLDP